MNASRRFYKALSDDALWTWLVQQPSVNILTDMREVLTSSSIWAKWFHYDATNLPRQQSDFRIFNLAYFNWKISVLEFSCQNQHQSDSLWCFVKGFVFFFSNFLWLYCTAVLWLEGELQMSTCMLAWTGPIWAAPGWGCSACSWRGVAPVTGTLCGSRWATQWCKLLPWTKKNLQLIPSHWSEVRN